jgi:hypothetical protein
MADAVEEIVRIIRIAEVTVRLDDGRRFIPDEKLEDDDLKAAVVAAPELWERMPLLCGYARTSAPWPIRYAV